MKQLLFGLTIVLSLTANASDVCGGRYQSESVNRTYVNETLPIVDLSIAEYKAHLNKIMGAECAEVIDESSRFIVKSYYRINSGENEGKFDERITILSNQK